MEVFFLIGSKYDEIELYDLLLSRYNDISFAMGLPCNLFVELIEKANYERRRDDIKQQWNALLPYMAIGQLKYMHFNDYYNQCTGANIDLRPASVIIAEIEEAFAEFGG